MIIKSNVLLGKPKPISRIALKPETTDLGDIIVIYCDGTPVGNFSFIGKYPHQDCVLRSSYIETPIALPMVNYWDITLTDAEKIVHEVLKIK